jgi:hypothetical protein
MNGLDGCFRNRRGSCFGDNSRSQKIKTDSKENRSRLVTESPCLLQCSGARTGARSGELEV